MYQHIEEWLLVVLLAFGFRFLLSQHRISRLMTG